MRREKQEADRICHYCGKIICDRRFKTKIGIFCNVGCFMAKSAEVYLQRED